MNKDTYNRKNKEQLKHITYKKHTNKPKTHKPTKNKTIHKQTNKKSIKNHTKKHIYPKNYNSKDRGTNTLHIPKLSTHTSLQTRKKDTKSTHTYKIKFYQ